MEVWKNIEETNGIYQVSNKGRVKRVAFIKINLHHGTMNIF